MSTGQSARSHEASVSVAPMFFILIVAAALLVGSLIGLGAASLLPHGIAAAVRPATTTASAAMVAIRADERASEVLDEVSPPAPAIEAALASVRAGERASETSLEAVLTQIRAEERRTTVP